MFIFGSMIGVKAFLKSSLIVSITLYIAGVVFLFPWLRYYIDYADTFAYIAIAEKYCNGDFSGAVNSTWSPLISWLLSLLLFTGQDSILLFKILQVALGLAGLLLTSKLIDQLKISGTLSFLLKVCLVPAFLSYALLWCTPDLLFLDILLLLHILFFRFNNPLKQDAIYIGLLGALLYFSKAYGIFYFPLLCLFGYGLFYMKANDRQSRQNILKNSVVSMAVFATVSVTWVTVISLKYNHFTVSDAAAYNFIVKESNSSEAIRIHPIISNGLNNPIPNKSLFAWEDPALYTPDITSGLKEWNLQGRMNTLQVNLFTLYYYQYKRQIGLLLLVVLAAAFFFLRKKFSYIPVAILMFTIFVFPAGYLLIHVVARYIWIVTILTALVTMYIAHQFFVGKKQWVAYVISIFCCFFLVKRPVKEILWREDVDKSGRELINGVLNLRQTLEQTYGMDKLTFNLASSLQSRNDLKGTVASYFNPLGSARESYPLSAMLCLRLGNPYYGQLNDTMIMRTGLQPLADNQIQFFYIWSENNFNKERIKNFPLLFADEKTKLKIYRVVN